MTASPVPAMFETHLPLLSGGWVSVYRAIWCLLAFAAAGFLAASVLYPSAHPAVLALRLVKGAVVIGVSAILLQRRGNDPVAALLSLAFLTWAISSSFDFASADLLPMLLDRVRFLLFVLALLLFPDGSWRPNWTRSVAVAGGGVFLLGLAEGVGVAPTHTFLPLAIACVIAALFSLFSRFREAESEAVRQQMKWVALGLVAGIGLILCARAGAALNALSPTFQPLPVLWEAIFQLGIVIVALGFLVSLLRYRLFDAETAISRSAALAVLTVVIVAVFAGTEATIENAGQTYLGMGIGNISAAMAAAVAAVLLNPLHERISDWAEQHFQRDLVRLKRELPRILDDLAPGASPRQLGRAILPSINAAVHATRSALIDPRSKVVGAMGAAPKEIERWRRTARGCGASLKPCDSSDPLFPVRLEFSCPHSGRTGCLLLGPRPDGSLYGKEDLDALKSVIPAIRQGLARTTAGEALQTDYRRTSRLLTRQIEQLHERIRALEAIPRAP